MTTNAFFCILSPPERCFNELLLNDSENIPARLRICIGSPQSRVIGMGGVADGEGAGSPDARQQEAE